MNSILTLAFLCLIGSLVYLVYRYFSGKKMIATDDLYSQRGVTVDYNAHTIKINSHIYDINKVTGVTMVTDSNGRRNTYYLKLEVDDMRKPVHKIAVIGSRSSAENFTQRICVAIRKAGGPNFY